MSNTEVHFWAYSAVAKIVKLESLRTRFLSPGPFIMERSGYKFCEARCPPVMAGDQAPRRAHSAHSTVPPSRPTAIWGKGAFRTSHTHGAAGTSQPRNRHAGRGGGEGGQGLSCRTPPTGWRMRFITCHTSEQGQRAHDLGKNDFVPLEGTET